MDLEKERAAKDLYLLDIITELQSQQARTKGIIDRATAALQVVRSLIFLLYNNYMLISLC